MPQKYPPPELWFEDLASVREVGVLHFCLHDKDAPVDVQAPSKCSLHLASLLPVPALFVN